MKHRPCEACGQSVILAYRVQRGRGPLWHFVCSTCLPTWQRHPDYRYGGTWNGRRHGDRQS